MLLGTFDSLRRATLLKQGVSKDLEVITHFLGTLLICRLFDLIHVLLVKPAISDQLEFSFEQPKHWQMKKTAGCTSMAGLLAIQQF